MDCQHYRWMIVVHRQSDHRRDCELGLCLSALHSLT